MTDYRSEAPFAGKGAGLNEATRRQRLVVPTDAEDEVFYKEQVAPILEDYYNTLKDNGHTPFHHTFKTMMGWVSDYAYMAGNFRYGSPFPFVEGRLVTAYREGGEQALQEAFNPLVDKISRSHNKRMDSLTPENMAPVLDAANQINRINEIQLRPGLMGDVIRQVDKLLTQIYNKPKDIAQITRGVEDHYRGLVGRQLYHKVTPEHLVEFAEAHQRGALKAIPLDVDRNSIEQHAKAFPDYLMR